MWFSATKPPCFLITRGGTLAAIKRRICRLFVVLWRTIAADRMIAGLFPLKITKSGASPSEMQADKTSEFYVMRPD